MFSKPGRKHDGSEETLTLGNKIEGGRDHGQRGPALEQTFSRGKFVLESGSLEHFVEEI